MTTFIPNHSSSSRNHFQTNKFEMIFNKITVPIFIVILLVTMYFSFSAWYYSQHPKNLDDIKLIEAPLHPIKIVPTDPGGEVFSNQERLIYNNIQKAMQDDMQAVNEVKPEEDSYKLRTPPQVAAKPKAQIVSEQKAQEPIKTKVKENTSVSKQEISPGKTTKKVPAEESKKNNNKASNPFDLLAE